MNNTDCGQPRSLAQELASRNKKNANSVGAATRMIWKYETGRSAILNAAIIPSRFQCRDVELRHPEIEETVARAGRCSRLHSGIGLAVVYHYARLGQPTDADLFVEGLATGVGLEDGSAVLALRNRLIDNAASKAKLSPNELWALSIKASNMFLSGRKVRFLKWARGADEQFPEIAGWPIGVKR